MYKLLSLDGGGVRGVITLHCLAAWEREHGVRVPDVFNAYSGTSIGSIIIALFAYLDWSANDILAYFVKENILHRFLPKSIWDRIFGIFQWQPKYNDSQRDLVLTKLFNDRLISDTNKKVLITSYDVARETSIYFTDQSNVRLVDALLISSAAPLYFSSTYIKSYAPMTRIGDNELYGIDGGITCNNPSDLALLDILSRNGGGVDTSCVSPNLTEGVSGNKLCPASPLAEGV